MRFFLGIIFILSNLAVLSNSIKVGVYTGQAITRAAVVIKAGEYRLQVDGDILSSDVEKVTFSTSNGKVRCLVNGSLDLSGSQVVLVSQVANSEFGLSPISPRLKTQGFTDNLIVKERSGHLVLVNECHLEKYVAGVVEAETGAKQTKEFYKVQAIISRTYALANKYKHAHEGFHLCDRVHCQVFHGKAHHNPDIVTAAYETQDLVLVDSNIELITAAFHSNCGGQTISSGKVWSQNLDYLKSVPDTFCLSMSQSHWEKAIPKEKWVEYLNRKRHAVHTDTLNTLLAYAPGVKEEFFFGEGSLRLVDVRRDWNLRSAWFTLHEHGDSVVFVGRGFGHGVGLCQEGAIRRAQCGQTYREILNHYYTDVHLIHLDQLSFFRD